MLLKIFAGILIFAGIYHFVNPAFYDPIMPDWFPKRMANAAGGIAEIILGVLLFLPNFRKLALLGTLILMVMFLGIHVWDLLRPRPAIGTHTVAAIRLAVQMLLVYWLFRLYQQEEVAH
ncbi:MauE/DoxX family redox-associated membrane protein [Lewinella sp. W8]|uniref:DoxX family protein n=1 Tax=Lewinella sp. W8 TaxID=2528208 RepID=UPI001067F4B1|nr:MauE/DoxX family redox-associated membrane protein [Lewinella sp. W8]MTB51077.1 hypothetical protein [Lewinella sp. W8]